MKRSRAVLAIMECLVEPHFDDVEKEASCILKKLEKLGMLPPHSDEVYQKNAKVYVYPTGNEWDAEDEAK